MPSFKTIQVGRSTQEILAEADAGVRAVIAEVSPLLAENMRHVSKGTRHALVENFIGAEPLSQPTTPQPRRTILQRMLGR